MNTQQSPLKIKVMNCPQESSQSDSMLNEKLDALLKSGVINSPAILNLLKQDKKLQILTENSQPGSGGLMGSKSENLLQSMSSIFSPDVIKSQKGVVTKKVNKNAGKSKFQLKNTGTRLSKSQKRKNAISSAASPVSFST